ncbi:MAG: HlyD family efflux transporter periplasmic adaptor subunit [Nitrospirota bacterium]|nr:HlyD family efflux transporter periplasmic adaptor subunit [Nitrospirota bacterium]MDH4361573.1 HlyD family efflux transporter periplasmic adaptor subunit [Nitrospirota bacterium]
MVHTAIETESPPQGAGKGLNRPSGPSGGSSPSPTAKTEPDSKIFIALLHAESQIRKAQTVQELCFLLANETRRLVDFRQACILSITPDGRTRCRVEAVSSVAIVDRNAPMIRWVERVISHLWEGAILQAPGPLSPTQCSKDLQGDWKNFAFPHVLWCPLIGADQQVMGGMWLSRETPWHEGEVQLIRRFAETVAHAWQALGGRKQFVKNWHVFKKWIWGVLVVLTAAMWLPVRLSTLAPVEVVPRDPSVVTAPLDGVLADILVHPNTMVQEGQMLFRYEDTKFRNQFEVAEKNLSVTWMEYRKVTQGAFLDHETGAGMPVQASEVRLKEAERDYAWEMLQHVEVKSPRTGIVIFGDKSEWIGKPVVVGERIMEVANPEKFELKIDLPVEDAIVLREGAEVEVFLNASPLQAIPATLRHASYHASILPTNVLAYRVEAEFTEPPEDIRIGWQGTAKVYGEQVTLFFYLFRRPLGVLRQTLGF